ncbi:hypothetical protein HIO71_17150 [Chryseobacterium aquaticum]|uniref:Uncharacterized protein n=1 Tax=Chryseobacterium aquaticum TaxID=452084 RepID=A0A848NAX9_9FLAO|nr:MULTISPECIES: hypothetical protein [Chryseobacterium]NMR35908.1 hypothetical protein [Chryseobacterium aquaticum]NRQ47983.1 hypothetical protein [Chryseobacterium sp. C-204]
MITKGYKIITIGCWFDIKQFLFLKNINHTAVIAEKLIYLTTKKTHLHEKQIDAQALPDGDSFAIS